MSTSVAPSRAARAASAATTSAWCAPEGKPATAATATESEQHAGGDRQQRGRDADGEHAERGALDAQRPHLLRRRLGLEQGVVEVLRERGAGQGCMCPVSQPVGGAAHRLRSLGGCPPPCSTPCAAIPTSRRRTSSPSTPATGWCSTRPRGAVAAAGPGEVVVHRRPLRRADDRRARAARGAPGCGCTPTGCTGEQALAAQRRGGRGGGLLACTTSTPRCSPGARVVLLQLPRGAGRARRDRRGRRPARRAGRAWSSPAGGSST